MRIDYDMSALKKYLREEVSPEELSKELDDMIFDIIMMYGESDIVSPQTLSGIVYRLHSLRDVLGEVKAICDL